MSWHRGPLLAFDTETTGVDPFEARIVQVGLSLISPEHGSGSDLWHINPGIPIPPGAAAVHGITDGQAAGFPHPTDVLPVVADTIAEHLAYGWPLIAFNAAYDCTLLEAELTRHRLPTITDRVGHFGPVIDPMVLHTQVSRIVSRKLEHLCGLWGVRHDGAHDAGHDALAAARLAWRIADRNPGLAAYRPDELHAQQAQWRREFCDAKRAEYDGLGQQHDGWDSAWPVRQRTAVAA